MLSSEESDDEDSPYNRVIKNTIADFDRAVRHCFAPFIASLCRYVEDCFNNCERVKDNAN